MVCPAISWTTPWLFLTDEASRWIAPQLPADPCGFPLGWTGGSDRPSYPELPYRDRVVGQRRLR